MNKWLAIFLLVFLPLQLTWTVADAYCQHESGLAAQHFGHHDHQHAPDAGKPVTPDPAQFGASDPDCGDCLAGSVSVLADSLTIAMLPNLAPALPHYRAHLPFPPRQPIERPQWLAHA
jgi:hypothetical protein